MPPSPVPADPGWDEDLTWLDRDPEREDWLARAREHDEPPGEDEDDENFELFTPEELAEIEAAAADELLAAKAATTGRRGPGQPGSVRTFPGESCSPAAAFGPGMTLDVLPGCAQLAVAADAAARDGFAGVSEAELVGVMCAWDRIEAHAHARKLAVVAELGRRNPGELDQEFTGDQVAYALGESRARADSLIGMAQTLPARLPGTAAGLEDGTISRYKAEIIAGATLLLEDDEARAAEQEVLDRAARLTPAGLRAAIARAVIKAAPKKAKERRETAAKNARVERWLQDTGNAALMGCELPPAEALAADEQITARAKELKAAGLEGDMDQLRARAYLDLLLGTDSRPRHCASPGDEATAATAPARFAARITLTAPLATLAGLADRPGELGSLGPVDPWLARDLARAAAASPKTTWCLTVTDGQGHAVAHGCARPEPKNQRNRAGPGPPGETGFSFTPAGRDGPPGGYGAWRLTTPGDGPDLIITIDPITTDPCDHRFESKGHDPGVKLRHLAQIRHATCTSPICRRPAAQADFEHNTPYEAGGRTCLCNGGPKCRHDHRLKQHPRWKVDQLPDGTFRWTTPAGRTYDTEPTRYPI
jgi:Domain of unknown function (DUF222)